MGELMRKRVRLVDIAKAAGVSVSTVSLALADHPRIGELTKRRVRQLSREMGYRRPGQADRSRRLSPSAVKSAARAHRTGRRFGGVLIGNSRDENTVDLVESLTRHAAVWDARMEIASIPLDASPQACVDQTMDFAERLDGVILTGRVTPRLLATLAEAHLPHVVVGRTTADPAEPIPVPTRIVAHDEMAMGRLATRWLLQTGHERVAFISEVTPRHMTNDRWLTGHRLAHMDHGCACDESLVRVRLPQFIGLRQAIEALLKLAWPPTAYVVPDPRVGRGVVDELDRRGVRFDPRAIVIGTSLTMIPRYGLDRFPLIQFDLEGLTEVALEHLMRVCDEPTARAFEIILPFTVHNLSMS